MNLIFCVFYFSFIDQHNIFIAFSDCIFRSHPPISSHRIFTSESSDASFDLFFSSQLSIHPHSIFCFCFFILDLFSINTKFSSYSLITFSDRIFSLYHVTAFLDRILWFYLPIAFPHCIFSLHLPTEFFHLPIPSSHRILSSHPTIASSYRNFLFQFFNFSIYQTNVLFCFSF